MDAGMAPAANVAQANTSSASSVSPMNSTAPARASSSRRIRSLLIWRYGSPPDDSQPLCAAAMRRRAGLPARVHKGASAGSMPAAISSMTRHASVSTAARESAANMAARRSSTLASGPGSASDSR